MAETKNADFINEIKAELKYLGEQQNYITKALKIPKTRLTCLMNQKTKFKPEEIIEIKELLGI